MQAEADITGLLREAASGDAAAQHRLIPLIYDNLRRLARRALAEQGEGRTLDTTALVHEVYLRLVDRSDLDWPDRRHFFGYVARAMRNLVVDTARRSAAQKRGGDGARDDDLAQLAIVHSAHDLVGIDQVLDRLAAVAPRLGELVELHVFAGLAFPEVAQCLDVSLRTVMRDWQKARALCASLLEEAGT
jgi:RNA polymerase sigma factor (TIGR02999 family)